MPSSGRKIHALIVVAVMLIVAACTPTRPPVDQLDTASRALAAARAAEAPTWAAEDYRIAGQHFDAAQAAMAREDYDVAAQLARESAADGELAAARARVAKLRDTVARLSRENAGLEADVSQSGDGAVQP